jgi:hypothetical protein
MSLIIKDKDMESENKTHLDISQKNADPISFFKDDGEFVFAYKKTERLASAVYMVTNFFDLNEPMKWTLRKKVSDMVSFVLTYKETFSGRKADFLYEAKGRILELVSLLEISLRAGLVSQMNFSILKQEFLNLIHTLEGSFSAGKDSVKGVLPGSLFEVGRVHFSSPQTFAHAHVSSEARSVKSKENIVEKPAPEQDLKRSNRQTVILDLLRRKGESTIKDISDVIKDCSEKTIQRELASFIATGLVKRKGERRWSKYSLV